MKYLKSINEAKKDEISVALGMYPGDTVRTVKFGTVTIEKIEKWGNKPAFYVMSDAGSTTLGEGAFKNSKVIDSPASERREAAARKKIEDAMKARERAAKKVSKSQYEKMIKSWVSQIGGDSENDNDMYSMIADTVDNFIAMEPDAVAYVQATLNKYQSDTPVRQQIQWDMEAES